MVQTLRHSPGNQETLRKVDWDEFTARLSAMNEHWFEGGSSVSVGCRGTGEGDAADEAAAGGEARDDDAVDPPASEPEPDAKAAELKARTLELIQDFPRLVRDFDKFVDCTRVTATRYGARNKR